MTNQRPLAWSAPGEIMTPGEMKRARESFDFTQKQMAAVLGIHPNALQNMEYGKNNIPKYIKNQCMALAALNRC